MSSSPLNPHLLHLGFRRALLPSPPTSAKRSSIPSLKLCRPGISRRSRRWMRFYTPIRAMDEDSVDFSSFFEEGDEVDGSNDYYVMSSSEEDDSDGVILNPIGDVELPSSKSHLEAPDGAFTVVAHRFANIQRGHKRNRKWLVPLPPPYGLLCMEKSYPVLTVVSFVAMGTGVNLTDGLDGLAGGVAAVAFIGLSVAAFPISPELAIFGASMSGASVGFLLHNRYKASIYMGGIGSLALGGAIAAMASCTGMFIPMVISSSFFILELFSVILQVPFMISMKQLTGGSNIILRIAPLHYHLKLWGLKEPYIVASAYIVSGVLALFAGYVGLISA